MNAGEGPQSYIQNSSYQRGALDVAAPIIEEEIARNLDAERLFPAGPRRFCIADFGCSTGHNSFPAIQVITQSIIHKLEPPIPEFHVFFNDAIANDFNTLFTSLPPHRNYLAAGVPGDFHRRLLPESSLHFAYSSWSLHWLPQLPKAVVDKNSPAWNKGSILYTRERKEVCDAYFDEFRKGMEAFLQSRAAEMVAGGLMVILIPGVPASWNPVTEYTIPSEINLFGSCLMDMAKMGRFSEAEVDSFNIPQYYATTQELKVVLEKSRSFSVERLEALHNPGRHRLPDADARAAFYRAVFEGLLTQHFGSGIMDELFDLYAKKIAASPEVYDAYLDQFSKDMEAFMQSRAVEMVAGGLMVILIPGVPVSWNPDTEYTLPSEINLLGSCLMDMANLGRFSEAEVDSFNIPLYLYATPQELKAVLDKCRSFSIERLEALETTPASTACRTPMHARRSTERFSKGC